MKFDMRLSVAEVAQAVGRTETYVRQHIHRKHLVAHKEGRNLYILSNEAIRWARERGLKIELLTRALTASCTDNSRTARMTVLTWNVNGAQSNNLFTLIRHRRKDTLGPWASKPDETWISEKLGYGVWLFSCDIPLECCLSLVDDIRKNSVLKIEGNEIHFSIESLPRRYWAYRDQRMIMDEPPVSPFSKHSAEIVEYWNVSHQFQEDWQGILSEFRDNFPQQFRRLGFPLNHYSERSGNLMIAAAADAMTCDLASNHNKTLSFYVDANEVRASSYQATVWASHCNDQVFRKTFPVVPGSTTFALDTDVDHIGFAVHREIDGQCIDLNEVYLIKEISIQGTIIGGPNLELHNRQDDLKHQSNLSVIQSAISVNLDREAAALDRTIRQKWLHGRAWKREHKSRRDRDFARFRSDQFDKAVEYFLSLLYSHSDQKEPIYFADPYFMHKLRKDPKLKDLCARMFEATRNHDLRILCAPKGGDRDRQRKLVESLNPISSHVQVRSFQLLANNNKNQKLEGGFHDRYLITPKREVVITHSINGWAKDGVTFARIPYNVYRDEAERLWSLEVGNHNNKIIVNKIV